MKREIKIVIIGAGSTYTPELIEGLIKKRNDLDIRELALMDIDSGKIGNCRKYGAQDVGGKGNLVACKFL